MRTNDPTTRDIDEHIADALSNLQKTVREAATSEAGDSRRIGILNSLGALLEQPVRAAQLLLDYDAERTRAHS